MEPVVARPVNEINEYVRLLILLRELCWPGQWYSIVSTHIVQFIVLCFN